MAQKPKLVKKTLIIHPIMDGYIRKTWSILIDKGHDATYSTALNVMLLMAIMEVGEKGCLTEKTNETISGFLEDQETITRLNLEDYLARLGEYYQGVAVTRR